MTVMDGRKDKGVRDLLGMIKIEFQWWKQSPKSRTQTHKAYSQEQTPGTNQFRMNHLVPDESKWVGGLNQQMRSRGSLDWPISQYLAKHSVMPLPDGSVHFARTHWVFSPQVDLEKIAWNLRLCMGFWLVLCWFVWRLFTTVWSRVVPRISNFVEAGSRQGSLQEFLAFGGKRQKVETLAFRVFWFGGSMQAISCNKKYCNIPCNCMV